MLLGLISFGIGIAGTILPILPGGPFFLFSAFCFGKSSQRIDNWFKSTKFYENYVVRIKENRGMTKKEKVRINIIADAFILFSVFYVDILLVRIVLIILMFYKHYYFIKKIKTITPEEAKLMQS
ncbi:YbaN family protein [Oceanobacillus sp. FSL K6-2867]|uniref:YbaN family protein n=1 Tax=Oceanobacillus sp. FSL K6-2867 TaxID=2954748 RepID=UPI0030DA7567